MMIQWLCSFKDLFFEKYFNEVYFNEIYCNEIIKCLEFAWNDQFEGCEDRA